MATNNAINANQTLSTTSSPIFNGLTLTSGTVSSVPSTGNDIVNKTYADSLITGLSWQAATVCATTGNLTATYANGAAGVGATLTNSGALAAFSSDGISPSLNDRVLVKDQSSTLQNGIYTLTTVGSGAVAWVLTRSTDYDSPAEIRPGDIVPVTSGTLYGSTTWIQTATVTTVGTDPIVFSQFSYNIQPLNKGGTSANLTASNGGIFYSTASAGAILSGTATANQMLQSGASSAPAWSTATWPATTTVNQILYSSSGNVVAGLGTANNGSLVTSNTGVPSILAGPGTTGNLMQSNAAAAPSWSTTTYPSTNSINTMLYASAANVMSSITPQASSVLVSNGSSVPSWSTTLPSGIALTNLTNWVQYTPTITGLGTPSVVEVYSRRVGDSLELRGYITSGTSTATELQITLGYNGTNANVTSSSTVLNSIEVCGTAGVSYNAAQSAVVLIKNNVGYINFGVSASGRAALSTIAGSTFLSVGDSVSFFCVIPIASFP